MHELSIALSIIDAATEEAQSRSLGKVKAVHLKLGALSGVVKDALLFAYEAASADSELQGSSLIIEDVPIVVYCDRCQCEREPTSAYELRCGICGEPSAQVVRGRELQVVALELAGISTAAGDTQDPSTPLGMTLETG